MISLTRINGEGITLNADLIEFIEATPDTLVSLTTGRKVMVQESVDEVVDRVVAYKRAVLSGQGLRSGRRAAEGAVAEPAQAAEGVA